MLNYNRFLQHVEQEIRGRFDDRYQISVRNIMRNNNTSLDGLVIFQSECNISPTIYLNPYYHRYLNGVSLADICDDIYETYLMHTARKNFDTDWLEDKMAVIDHIVMRLVNYENNKEMLANMPYIPFKDLAIIFAVKVDHEDIGEGSILVNNSCLDLWQLSAEELLRAALDNAPAIHPPCFSTIMESLIDLCNLTGEFPALDMSDNDECPMYVLTNEAKHYGASAILYPGLLKKIAEGLKSDLVLIPSSIHEFIIMASRDAYDLDVIGQMIKEVNETELTDEELLSDHAYYYRLEDDFIYTDQEIMDLLA